jgi:hypothetical protein
LRRLDSGTKNIITIEDPIEYQIQGIGQIQVNPKIQLNFASGLRSILRQDPDIIMVGEIRDVETAEIAIQASLTGHLVLSTLHTNDSASAVTRLVDMGIEPFLVASSLSVVVAQRLVRKLCPACRAPYTPTAAQWGNLGLSTAPPVPFYAAGGCAACLNTGYLGRVGLFEILPADDRLRALILTRSDADGIVVRRFARMRTILAAGAEKVCAGSPPRKRSCGSRRKIDGTATVPTFDTRRSPRPASSGKGASTRKPPAARKKLHADGCTAFGRGKPEGRRLLSSLSLLGTQEFLPLLTRQLSTLVGAGVPVVSALQSLGSQVDDPEVRRVIAELQEAVRGGIPFGKAIEAHPKMFPELYASMVRAGEEGGMLPLSLSRLADHLEDQARTRNRVGPP